YLVSYRMDFDVRAQLFARSIGDAQAAVGNLAPGVFKGQLCAKSRRLDLCAAHGQLHAQRAFAIGPLLNNEILPHAIHAHAVFLRESGPDEARALAVNGHCAAIGETWSVRGAWSVERQSVGTSNQ